MTLATTKANIAPLEAGSVERFQAGLKARAEVALDTVVFTVAAEDYRALCERLYRAGFDFPNCLSGTDMDWGLGVTLHLQSLETKHKVAVRTYVPYDQAKVVSVSDLWGGVEWHEREAYDLVGITFENHPDLRRILTEDHWTIHPLQRRYDTRGYLIPDWQAKPWPSPAPWEEGFTAFAAVAAPAAAHAAPAKAEGAKPAAKPAPVTPKPETSSALEPASSPAPVAPVAPAAPSATASSETAPSSTVSSDAPAAPAPTKERKRWEPKGNAAPAASSPAPTEASPPAASAATPAPSAPATPEPVKAQPEKTDPQKIASAMASSKPASSDQDDLKRIEGIGPKINDALQGAGITTFMQLAAMSEDQLKGFLETAGLPFAPSVTTWVEQAGFLARGDEAGFKALAERLSAGREETASASEPVSSQPSSAPAVETPATPSEEKPKSPKIKRWEPKS